MSYVWVYGIHSVEAAISNPNKDIRRLCALKSVAGRLRSFERRGLHIEVVNKGFFISTFGRDAIHQGCAALVQENGVIHIEDIVRNEDNNDKPIVILDLVTDPHNIGAILRSCAVFDARCVVVQDSGSPDVTPVVAKASSGASELIPLVRVTNISRTLQYLKDNMFWCIGLGERTDKYLNEMDLKGKFAFVIGSEGEGMRRLTMESCDVIAKLPSSDRFSTLNAAQACTVALYESFRQRMCS